MLPVYCGEKSLLWSITPRPKTLVANLLELIGPIGIGQTRYPRNCDNFSMNLRKTWYSGSYMPSEVLELSLLKVSWMSIVIQVERRITDRPKWRITYGFRTFKIAIWKSQPLKLFPQVIGCGEKLSFLH